MLFMVLGVGGYGICLLQDLHGVKGVGMDLMVCFRGSVMDCADGEKLGFKDWDLARTGSI